MLIVKLAGEGFDLGFCGLGCCCYGSISCFTKLISLIIMILLLSSTEMYLQYHYVDIGQSQCVLVSDRLQLILGRIVC